MDQHYSKSFFSLFRMTANSTQPSHAPLELSVMNIEHDFNIHPLLSFNITAASQPSFISFNQTDMIPSATIPDSRVRNNAEQINELTTEQQTLPTQDTETVRTTTTRTASTVARSSPASATRATTY